MHPTPQSSMLRERMATGKIISATETKSRAGVWQISNIEIGGAGDGLLYFRFEDALSTGKVISVNSRNWHRCLILLKLFCVCQMYAIQIPPTVEGFVFLMNFGHRVLSDPDGGTSYEQDSDVRSLGWVDSPERPKLTLTGVVWQQGLYSSRSHFKQKRYWRVEL